MIARWILFLFVVGNLGCMSSFYYPDKNIYYDPRSFGLIYEDQEILTSKNERIHYRYFPSATSKNLGLILFFHGNAQNLTSHFAMLAWLPSHSFSYIIFDYPGYGQSSGQPSPEATTRAGIAMAHKAKSLFPQLPLFLYGQSLGGNIAQKTHNEVSSEVKINGVILESTFGSYKEAARSLLSQHWLTWALQPLTYLVLSDEFAGKVEALAPTPLLIIHGTDDSTVSFDIGKKLFLKAREPKEFLEIHKGGHGNTYFLENGKYRDDLLKFLNKNL